MAAKGKKPDVWIWHPFTAACSWRWKSCPVKVTDLVYCDCLSLCTMLATACKYVTKISFDFVPFLLAVYCLKQSLDLVWPLGCIQGILYQTRLPGTGLYPITENQQFDLHEGFNRIKGKCCVLIPSGTDFIQIGLCAKSVSIFTCRHMCRSVSAGRTVVSFLW